MSFKRITMGGMRFPLYTRMELKLAIGTVIKTVDGEGLLQEVNDGWVILQVGKFTQKKHKEVPFRGITYVPIVENLYNTKLGKLTKI